MDGKTLTELMLDALDTPIRDELFNTDPRVVYHCIDRAAVEFCRQTRILTKYHSITTVAQKQEYELPPDYIGLAVKKSTDKYVIRYDDGTSVTWPQYVLHDKIFLRSETTPKDIPSAFTIINRTVSIADNLIRGTVTLSDKYILADSTKNFNSTHRTFQRDIVHNIKDKSSGLVLDVLSNTQLFTVLFKGMEGILAEWTNGDEYAITRTSSHQLVLDAPSEKNGHIINVPYVAMPNPVYTEFSNLNLPVSACHAIACEAAFFWQNRKGKYPSADRHHIMFMDEVYRTKVEIAKNALTTDRQYY